MKYTPCLLFIALLLTSGFVGKNPELEEIVVAGLRFDKASIAAFKSMPEQPAFFIDAKDILRPTQNYQIIYVKAEKALVAIPKTTSYSTFKQLDGYEEIELPGGILIGCMCSNGFDDCQFDNSKIEYKFECKGSCRCYIGVVFNWNSLPLEYQISSGGRWYNF
jgi:hypothetical protein